MFIELSCNYICLTYIVLDLDAIYTIMFELCEILIQLEYCTTYDVYIVQNNQRVKCPEIRLFCVFGYNYRVIDKVPRIGKYGFTRVYILC